MIIYAVETPARLHIYHIQHGGSDLARFGADLADGQLRIMSGREPAGKGGRLILHVSVSVGSGPESPPTRRATDAEVEHAKRLWPAVQLVEELYEANSMIRHFWEAE